MGERSPRSRRGAERVTPEGAEVSRTHERAVLEQDNGEPTEDVATKRSLERADTRSGTVDEEGVDEEGRESFPASDPPSSWIGGADDHGRDASGGEDHPS